MGPAWTGLYICGAVSTPSTTSEAPIHHSRAHMKNSEVSGVRSSMSLTCCHRPIMAARHTSIWAKIAVVEPIILYETAKIRTATTVEGIAHPFGTCMEGFEVVCNFSHAVMLTIPGQTQPQSPQTESCHWSDRRMGVWCRKEANNPLLQRPSSII